MVISRGGAAAARRAHNPEVAGSNPAPATVKITEYLVCSVIFIYRELGGIRTQEKGSGKT